MDNGNLTACEVARQRAMRRCQLEAPLSGSVGLAYHNGLAGGPFLNSAPPDAQIRALKAKIAELEKALCKEN